jgi:hypothetical protein
MAPRKHTPSTEIALAAKAGELALAGITFDQSEVQALRDSYNSSVKSSVGDKVLGTISYTAGTVMLGLGAAATVAMTGGIALLPLAGLMGGMMLSINSSERNSAMRTAEREGRNAQYELRRIFRNAQIDAFNHNQKQLVAAANGHLQAGGLLDEEAMAYLAAVSRENLSDACEQLAISVYQARKMLAHSRSPEYVEKPLNFASLDFTAKSEKHRFVLLEKLQWADSDIDDDKPELQGLELQEPEFQRTAAGRWARTFLAPFYLRKDARIRAALDLPDLPDVPVPPLRPARDFALTLHRYEEQNGRLDLPALRGWPQTQKALPRPPAF